MTETPQLLEIRLLVSLAPSDGEAEMRRLALSCLAVVGLGMVTGLAGCSSSSSSPTTTTASATKTAFCSGNTKIDKDSVNVTSLAGFVTVLKNNQSTLAVMAKNIPPGAIGNDVRQTLAAATAAIAGNTNPLNNLPSSVGASIDTYCGVDGSGNPLPAYFATGKGTSFCATFLPIYQAVGNANGDPTAILAALNAHRAQVDQLAAEVSRLPDSIKSKASATVNKAQTAIAQNSAASLNTQNGNGDAASVALYCGQNM